jgi:hypothetical protein
VQVQVGISYVSTVRIIFCKYRSEFLVQVQTAMSSVSGDESIFCKYKCEYVMKVHICEIT